MKKLTSIALLFGMLILCGCGGGGGGGGGSGSQTVPSAPVVASLESMFSTIATQGINGPFTIGGWINNGTPSNPQPNTDISGSGTISMGPAQAGTFQTGPLTGTAELQQIQIISGTTNGNTFNGNEYIYYNPSNYSILATWTSATENLYYSDYVPPSSVKAGDTGTLGNGTVYSVAADGATTLLVTISSGITNSGGGQTNTQTVYRIGSSGSVALVSINTQKLYLGSEYESLTFTF